METMKRLLLLMLVTSAAWAQTGLPTTAENKTDFYAELKAVRDSIVVKEDLYFKKNKKYFQGLPSDTTSRDISLSLKRFERSLKPDDQKETWEDFGLKDISVRGTYRVDVYNGPAGWGYIISVSIAVEKDKYELIENLGPEQMKDTGSEFIKTTAASRLAAAKTLKL
jgi:hypothetical protein